MMKKHISMYLFGLMTLLVSACSNGDAAGGQTAQVAAKTTAETRTAPPATAVNGEGFVRIAQPVRTSDANKIEVVEVFWYGCSHCFDFEPMVSAWAKQLPEDVAFVQSPAMWNDLMVLHAQAFYTAKALNILDQVHEPLFDEINLKKNPLRNRDAIEKLFLEHSNIDAETFRKTFDSFGVKSQVRQADSRARSYGIAGTPELIVNGKYRVTGRAAGSKANMLKVAEQLIEQERAAR